MHLWDPELAPGRNHFVMLRDRIKRNQLGLLVEEDAPQAVPTERLQMVAEETWYASDPARQASSRRDEKLEQEQRLKAAQLIKQQRLRIASLEQQRDADIARLRQLAAEQQAGLQAELERLQRELLVKEQQTLELERLLGEQTEGFQKSREEMSRQLRALEQSSRAEAQVIRAGFEEELQRQVAAAVSEYREQVAIRDVELAYRNELDSQLQGEIDALQAQRDSLLEHSGERVLARLATMGVAFMAYHPGAGHLTIPLSDIARYQDNPLAYAAAKCAVSEAQYGQWVQHYQQPTCVATLSSGERCNMPLDKVDAPAHFIVGESNCCARHRSQDRLRTGS